MTATVTNTKHPAPFSAAVLREIRRILDNQLHGKGSVLDPFAGVGGIHNLAGYLTYAVEIEPEWADVSRELGPTLCTDSRTLTPFLGVEEQFDAIVTSPTYGNRMADHHNAKDGSYRRTYKHLLGRDLTPGNSGGMQWGEEYRQLHRDVYANMTPLVRSGGLFVLNIKDHIRKGDQVRVGEFHISCLLTLGWSLESTTEVSTPGFRFGANRGRLPEYLYTLVKSRVAV